LIPEVLTDSEVETEVKQWIVKKAAGAVRSSTIGVAALIVTVGGWVQLNPEFLSFIPEQFQGVAIAAVGLVVAVARLRTAGK